MLEHMDVPRGRMPLGDIPGDWIAAAMTERFGAPVRRLRPMPWKPVRLGAPPNEPAAAAGPVPVEQSATARLDALGSPGERPDAGTHHA